MNYFKFNDQNSSKKVNQNSIKEQIKQQTTQTKLTSLFTKWDEENDSIKELFKQQETIIKKNGGQNVKQW